jgi:hypothetical protein
MAIPTLPTFSAGEILTSDVMNDVSILGNYQGLFYIGSTTITSLTTAVLDGCFSSDFRDYLLTVDVTGGSANTELFMQFRVGGVAAATNYNYASFGTFPNGTVSSSTTGGTATGGALTFVPQTQQSSFSYYIGQPNLAVFTSFSGDWLYDDGGAQIMRRTIGRHKTATAYTGVQVFTSAAWTGKISVYGYRKSI